MRATGYHKLALLFAFFGDECNGDFATTDADGRTTLAVSVFLPDTSRFRLTEGFRKSTLCQIKLCPRVKCLFKAIAIRSRPIPRVCSKTTKEVAMHMRPSEPISASSRGPDRTHTPCTCSPKGHQENANEQI
jgi:hypothetical protein